VVQFVRRGDCRFFGETLAIAQKRVEMVLATLANRRGLRAPPPASPFDAIRIAYTLTSSRTCLGNSRASGGSRWLTVNISVRALSPQNANMEKATK
jgi:hypothetical protein